VKANPLEYTSKVIEIESGEHFNNLNNIGNITNNNKWMELELEAKIQTLSSQHQGSYFYIHFQLKLVDCGQEMYVKGMERANDGADDGGIMKGGNEIDDIQHNPCINNVCSYCELDTPSIQVISKKVHSHVPIQRRKPASDIVSLSCFLNLFYFFIIFIFIFIL
jgi:hypothetical protein